MPRRTRRGKAAESSGAIHPSTSPPSPPALSLSLFLSLAMLLTGIESAATHVSDQVQPASSVSKLQAPGKPTESTFIAGDPVTECVIHYSLICTPYPHPLTHPTTSPIQPWGNSTAWSNPSLSILVVLPLLAFLFTRCSGCVSGLFAAQRRGISSVSRHLQQNFSVSRAGALCRRSPRGNRREGKLSTPKHQRVMKCSRARWQTPRGANLGEESQGSNAWGERSLGSTAEDRMIASVLSQLNCHSIPKYKAWRWLGFHSPRQLPPHTLPTVVCLDVMFAMTPCYEQRELSRTSWELFFFLFFVWCAQISLPALNLPSFTVISENMKCCTNYKAALFT